SRKCVEGCPVQVDIPEFVALVAEGDFDAAAATLKRTNALPAICGRVCPQESQCEAECVRGVKGLPVAIGFLERFVADWAMAGDGRQAPPAKPEPTGFKVAIVGAGPGGLTAAGELAKLGHEVRVFEALHAAGGVLRYGIPQFRLPKEIVDREVANLESLGVKLEYDVIVGKTITISQIMEEFDACFIANGAGLPMFLNIPGENFKGVYSANEYLTRVNLMGAWKGAGSRTPVMRGGVAVVFGGGNTAMDGVGTPIKVEQEPGSSGVYTIDHIVRNVLMGYQVSGERSTGNKMDRAKPLSSQAEAGNVYLVRGAWNKEYLQELHGFPQAGRDDQVDASSGAFKHIAGAGASWDKKFQARNDKVKATTFGKQDF
ncbi:hypothetical protein LCGC14_1500990, partial [marine sediment metagenome]